MPTQQHYRVRLENVPETEQLITRLIFSITQRCQGSRYVFSMAEPNNHRPEDIVIYQRPPLTDTGMRSRAIELVDTPLPDKQGRYHIVRPLIASRVLAVLERYVEDTGIAQRRRQVKPEPTPAATARDTEPARCFEFSISEEEASQLAIVADEVLENPANQDVHSNLLNFPLPETAKPVGPGYKPRVLVVDDSASVRKQIELELALFEADMNFADSAGQAHQLLEKYRFDVAFLDVVLPDGDGFKICKHIKQTQPNIHVIMLTGKARPGDKIKGTMSGCDAYLVKPVGRVTFQTTVSSYLKLKIQDVVINA
ncbi:MAG: response regulator [Gammaproteobacteria bacterium]|nr:response regulator [Gammaproteobacteria bacterium]